MYESYENATKQRDNLINGKAQAWIEENKFKPSNWAEPSLLPSLLLRATTAINSEIEKTLSDKNYRVTFSMIPQSANSSQLIGVTFDAPSQVVENFANELKRIAELEEVRKSVESEVQSRTKLWKNMDDFEVAMQDLIRYSQDTNYWNETLRIGICKTCKELNDELRALGL